MSDDRALKQLSREERIALCHEVMDRMSELAEGTAPPDFCERVEHLLGDCQPFQAFKDTLEATLTLLRECGESRRQIPASMEDCFARGVARARARLGETRRDGDD